MALARIFTHHPEHAGDLARQLQQHGYSIEVLSPEEAPASPADLEIQMEICDPASVLRRAGELATRLHADVAVAPGVLQIEPLPAEAVAHSSLSQDQDQDQPIAPAEPAVPIAAPIEPLPVAPPGEAAGIALPIESQSEAPTSSSIVPAARTLGAALASCAAVAGKLVASARDQFRESWELARIRNAEAHAIREQRLLELTRQRASAQQRALELAAERRDMAVYLLQLQQEVPNAFADLRRQWSSAEDAAPVEPPARAWRLKIRRIHSRKWEAVFAGLLSASALFAIGLAVASFHSGTPEAATSGATVQTGGVTLKGAQPKSDPRSRPSPGLRKLAQKPATPRAYPAQRRVQREEVLANDVVVRHFARPTPTPRTQADGWKHFSDMDN